MWIAIGIIIFMVVIIVTNVIIEYLLNKCKEKDIPFEKIEMFIESYQN
jgi:hypothetical protein